jgi:uncharacterized protein YaaR (DUF327 family)
LEEFKIIWDLYIRRIIKTWTHGDGFASSRSQANLEEFKNLWDLYIRRIIQRPWSISNKFGGVQEFMRSLYTSDNTKTMMDLKQIWRSSRIYEIFIFVG